MRDTFSTVHLKNCEIYPDQLHFQEQIGEGKFGVVYKGIWKGRACAIKKLKTGISKESVQYQRQLIELGILACVGTHPNIVGFWGACIQDISSPLIVEELVDGMNLEEILSRKSIGFNLGRATVKVIPRPPRPQARRLRPLQALRHLRPSAAPAAREHVRDRHAALHGARGAPAAHRRRRRDAPRRLHREGRRLQRRPHHLVPAEGLGAAVPRAQRPAKPARRRRGAAAVGRHGAAARVHVAARPRGAARRRRVCRGGARHAARQSGLCGVPRAVTRSRRRVLIPAAGILGQISS